MYEIKFAEGYEKKAIKFFKKHKDIYDKYKKAIGTVINSVSTPNL